MYRKHQDCHRVNGIGAYGFGQGLQYRRQNVPESQEYQYRAQIFGYSLENLESSNDVLDVAGYGQDGTENKDDIRRGPLVVQPDKHDDKQYDDTELRWDAGTQGYRFADRHRVGLDIFAQLLEERAVRVVVRQIIVLVQILSPAFEFGHSLWPASEIHHQMNSVQLWLQMQISACP